MKSRLCVMAVLASAAAAGADVRLFVTGSNQPYGLTSAGTVNGQTNALVPTFATVDSSGAYANAYDFSYHKLGAAPPIDAPDGTPENPILFAPDEFAYVWFQFRGEPKGAIVNHLTVDIRNEATGLSAAGAFAWYKQDNRNSGSAGYRRWDGAATPPGYSEWTNNPQTLAAAVPPEGIINAAVQPAAEDNWNLYTWQAGTSYTLTGASLLGACHLAPGLYSIHVSGPSYFAPIGDPIHDTVGYFRWVPEPASLLLLGLATLPLRRRRTARHPLDRTPALPAPARPAGTRHHPGCQG